MMDELTERILNHPANQQYLEQQGRDVILDFTGIDTWSLGTHPDLMDEFWALGRENSPADVNPVAAVGGRPVLVHPTTGVIYGMATGSYVHRLRLPAEERAKAITLSGETKVYPNITFHASDYGDDWAFIETWRNPDVKAWHRAAYDYAGE